MTARGGRVEALAFLHLATSLYVLIPLVSSSLVQAAPFFYIPYAVVGLTGTYIGSELLVGRGGMWLKVASAITICLGMSVSSYLFFLGLIVRGIVGPTWVLFLVCAWLLWSVRKSI